MARDGFTDNIGGLASKRPNPSRVGEKLLRIVKLLRVKQYTKNLFALAALLFTRSYTNLHLLALTLGAIGVMCCLSSATYIINDLFDIERDRAHPKKRLRPIASGEVSPRTALLLALALCVGGLVWAGLISRGTLACGAFYLVLQVLYNLSLKHIPIADVFVIATGFVLRVVIGGVAIGVALSGWILLCTGALALLLGFGKRRSEFVAQGKETVTRESLREYTLHSLDSFVVASATSAVICYGLYGIESQTAKQYPGLILSIPFVAYFIYRYVLLIFSDIDTAEPESVVLQDRQLAVASLLFIASVLVALAGFNPNINLR